MLAFPQQVLLFEPLLEFCSHIFPVGVHCCKSQFAESFIVFFRFFNSSTTISFVDTEHGLIKIGSRMILLENSFPYDTELYRLMRLEFLQCIFCCFFSENQVYYRCMYGTDRKRRLSEGSVKK